MCNKSKSGFTLIEMMVVIAIIAIVSAIAIPNFLGASIAGNEKSAIISLNTIGSAQDAFRKEDVDGNGRSDYLTGDIQGLYCAVMSAAGLGEIARKIDQALAEADGSPAQGGYAAAGFNADTTLLKPLASRQPLNGYWFRQMPRREDASGVVSVIDPDGDLRDLGVYAVIAYPHLYGRSGKRVFIKGLSQDVHYIDPGSETAVIGVLPPDLVPHPALTAPYDTYPYNKQNAGWHAVK